MFVYAWGRDRLDGRQDDVQQIPFETFGFWSIHVPIQKNFNRKIKVVYVVSLGVGAC
jgi:hypothetical protein